MQVEDLLRAVPSGQLYGPEIKGEITQLVNDTRNLVPGCAFVAIKGLELARLPIKLFLGSFNFPSTSFISQSIFRPTYWTIECGGSHGHQW